MKARAGEPANTISRGSSPTIKVRETWGVPLTETTLTLSERWFTTQTSLLFRAATATGSMPTGTRPWKTTPAGVMLNISSVPLGVFTANSMVPSGDIAMGRTGPLSNSTNEGPVEEAATGVALRDAPMSASRVRRKTEARMPPLGLSSWAKIRDMGKKPLSF